MKNLIIIGARGYGRETYNIALESNEFSKAYTIKGFLDDNKKALDGCTDYPPIIDSVEHYEIQTDDVFICALGDVKYRKKYTDMILSRGGEFINVIHSTAYIGKNTRIGIGCILARYVNISCDIKIGNFVCFQPFATVGHDCNIGNDCMLNTYSFCGGGVSLEDEVTLNTCAIIQPHKIIHKNATIGAGAFVIRDVESNTTVYGNPAQRLEY